MLDGKEQGWVDLDSHPSLASLAPFLLRFVSYLQSFEEASSSQWGCAL